MEMEFIEGAGNENEDETQTRQKTRPCVGGWRKRERARERGLNKDYLNVHKVLN